MYSRGDISVDKGLGFDFSAITDLVKSALPVGLNIYQNQMQLKQIKAMGSSSMHNGYNVPVVNLPGFQMYGMQPQSTFGGQYPVQSSGIGTGTMLAVGAAAVVGLLAYKLLR